MSPVTGSILTNAAILTVRATTNPGRLINLSILTPLAAGETMTMGTVLGGAGTSGSKPLLVRAAGPSLTPLGVAGALPDPNLVVLSGQTVVGSNDDWAGNATLSAAFTQVGAFPYESAASKDSAIYSTAFSSGGYTAQVTGNGGTGTVIAEIYDATPPSTFTAATPRLINVSVLKQIGAGSNLTAGFVIDGSTAKTVLIRVIGPGLAKVGVTSGTLGDPQLTLFNNSAAAIATDDNWGGDSQLAAVSASVGAFAVSNPASKDAMLVVTLAPGNYTAQASGNAGTSGLAIVEVYDVP